MIALVSQRYPRIATLVRYVVAGGLAAVTNISTLYILTDLLGVWYLAAGVISFIFGMVVSFLLQKRLTFQDASWTGAHRKFVLYASIQTANLFANTLLLYLLTERVGIHHLMSQMLSSVIIAVWSFFLYKMVVFTGRLGQEEHP